jgi:hypothetical protein
MGGLGGDNMSIIIICFLHGRPWQDLVDRCKKIHADKKASSKLSEPAFTAFDRFASDGPFSDVSALKDDLNSANDTSSSSHTSSPSSSSPISKEDLFDNLLNNASGSTADNNIKSNEIKEIVSSEEKSVDEVEKKSSTDDDTKKMEEIVTTEDSTTKTTNERSTPAVESSTSTAESSTPSIDSVSTTSE